MTGEANVMLELDDIQSGVLRPRPTPYAATYIVLRIDDRNAGTGVDAAVERSRDFGRESDQPLADTWVSVALSYQGLKALGVPQDSLTASPGNSGRGWPRAQKL